MNLKSLHKLACDAQKNAYAPYSKFRVGAAVLTKNGKMFSGCNIENASYGAAICAERSAIANAIIHGDKKIEAVLVVTSTPSGCAPCGICRQFISEFNSACQVIIATPKKIIKTYLLSELLPNNFSSRDLR